MELDQQARDIFLSTLFAIDIGAALKRRIRLDGETLLIDQEAISLKHHSEIVLVGFGKASLTMGAALEEVLGGRLTRGILVTDRRHKVKVRSEVIVAGHPLPDDNSLIAGERILSMINACDEKALVFFLISGGGSVLVESLISPDVSLEDIREQNRLLISCGASIKDINTIRKELSRIKGGKLGRLAQRLRAVAVFVSDVNPGDFLSLASNPLLSEESDLEEAQSIITRYGLMRELPESIGRILAGKRSESGAERWQWEEGRLSKVLLMENADAIKAAGSIAEGLGYIVALDFNTIEGQYQAVADDQLNRILELYSRYPRNPVCVVSGGEVSCRVRGSGLGGRNQEYVLYSATRSAAIESSHAITILSCGTDGIDGNSSAAGAVAGPHLIRAAINQGADIAAYADRSDTHTFFKQFGGAVFTGPTGNNVRDVRILLANPVSI